MATAHVRLSPSLAACHQWPPAKSTGRCMLFRRGSPTTLKCQGMESQAAAAMRTKSVAVSRRILAVVSSIAICAAVSVFPKLDVAMARERRNKKIAIEEFQTNGDGLKYFDIVQGNGPVAEDGETVLVHFDCIYRGINAVSSRESKILSGNRILSQPYEFVVGSTPGRERKREFLENANGLFSAQAAPKPPLALYKVTEGMHVGGKSGMDLQRTVIVTPDAGYGNKGMNEIPPDATFEMNIELLEVKKPTATEKS